MKKFKIEMYDQNVMVFRGPDDLARWIKRHLEDGPVKESLMEDIQYAGGLGGVLFSDRTGEGGFFVYVSNKCTKTISHESLHVAVMLLDMVNIKFDVSNHESLTYLQDFIFGKVCDALKIPTNFDEEVE